MGSLVNFFKGVNREMKKVSWPKGKDLFKYTVIVISTTVLFGVFFFVIDIGISNLIQLILK